MSENNSIFIKGARINNLKNIDVDIPRDKLVVITGLSGRAAPLCGEPFRLCPPVPGAYEQAGV